jgi:F-type H+-transporting ATPase subunit c
MGGKKDNPGISDFSAVTMLPRGRREPESNKRKRRTKGKIMLDILPMLAADAGGIPNFAATLPLAFAGLGAGIGVGIVGGKAAEAVGRNPSAFGSIMVMAIIGMALAEAIAIYGLIIAFIK